MSTIEQTTSVRARIRHLMEIRGLYTAADFAAMTGVPEKTIRGILRRDAIGAKSAKQIAQRLKISYGWLKYGEGAMGRPSFRTPEEGSDSIEPITVTMDPFRTADLGGQKSIDNSVQIRLLELQDALELGTISALANAAGIAADRLKALMEADAIDESDARQIARSLHISFDWLMTGRGPMYLRGAEIQGFTGFPSDEAAATLRESIRREPPEHSRLSYSLVPKAQTKISAGGGILPEEGTTGEEYAFREEWLRGVASDIRRVILLDVDGDSMATTLLDKDTVLIDLDRTTLREGRIYAIAVGDVVQIKRLQLMAGTRIKVISDNPAYHTYDVQADEIRIIGQAIWFGRTLI